MEKSLSWNSRNNGSAVNIIKIKKYVDSFCHRSYFTIYENAVCPQPTTFPDLYVYVSGSQTFSTHGSLFQHIFAGGPLQTGATPEGWWGMAFSFFRINRFSM